MKAPARETISLAPMPDDDLDYDSEEERASFYSCVSSSAGLSFSVAVSQRDAAKALIVGRLLHLSSEFGRETLKSLKQNSNSIRLKMAKAFARWRTLATFFVAWVGAAAQAA